VSSACPPTGVVVIFDNTNFILVEVTMKNFVTILLFAGIIFYQISCTNDNGATEPEGKDPEGAMADIELANQALADVLYALVNGPEPESIQDINFSVPYGLYSSAFSKDPANFDANFGMGLTGIFMITQEQQLNDAFEEWQSYLETGEPFQVPLGSQNRSGLDIGFPTSLRSYSIHTEDLAKTIVGTHKIALSDAPKISTIQNVFESSLLPKLTAALSKLDYVDDNPQYVFTVTPKMQGDLFADPLEIDLTEIYALQVSLHMLKVVIDMAVAYDLDITSYDSLGIIDALSPGSSFLTVRNSGQSLTDAKNSFLTAIDKLEAGIDFLRNETDSQDDDIIKLDPGSEVNADLDSILAYSDEAREFLTTGLTFTEDWDDDEFTPDEELTINLGEYFDTPVQDLKSLFPSYTVSVGKDTSYDDYNYDYGQAQVYTTANVGTDGYYYYYRQYSWDRYGYEYAYADSNLSVPAFKIAFEDKVTELRQIDGLEYMYLYFYWGSTLTSGESNIDETLYWNYQYASSEFISYYPILNWTAESFDQWILPDPTIGGVLPGMTDVEFKRIFGITEEDWRNMGGL